MRVPAAGTRPTSAKVREAIFSKLSGWGLLQDTRVLDLFAGSGALGFEALSRGASKAVFVERSAAALKVVRANARQLGFENRCVFRQQGALPYLRRLEGTETNFDVVFADPPYAWQQSELGDLLTLLPGALTADGIVVVERTASSPTPPLPPGLTLEDHRVWGDTAAWFLGPAPVSP